VRLSLTPWLFIEFGYIIVRSNACVIFNFYIDKICKTKYSIQMMIDVTIYIKYYVTQQIFSIKNFLQKKKKQENFL
jgi:hypothetical protein